MTRTPISKDTIQRYIRMGLTQREMVDKFYEETGERRARSSFAVAASRKGVTNPRSTPHYDLPWKNVPREHYCYEQRMLRALRSRERGKPNKDARDGTLDKWMEMMDSEQLVIMYEPTLGFFRVPREPADVGYVTVTNLPQPNQTVGSVR